MEQYHAHAACVVELSKAQEDVPKYTGFTGDNDKPIQKPNKDNMEETIPTEGGAATDQTSTGEKGNQKKCMHKLYIVETVYITMLYIFQPTMLIVWRKD